MSLIYNHFKEEDIKEGIYYNEEGKYEFILLKCPYCKSKVYYINGSYDIYCCKCLNIFIFEINPKFPQNIIPKTNKPNSRIIYPEITINYKKIQYNKQEDNNNNNK